MGPFPQIRTLVDQAIQAVTSGADVNTTLADTKTKADKALADYNSRLTPGAAGTMSATMAATMSATMAATAAK